MLLAWALGIPLLTGGRRKEEGGPSLLSAAEGLRGKEGAAGELSDGRDERVQNQDGRGASKSLYVRRILARPDRVCLIACAGACA
mmetsp:Transcript_18720/g.37835  ORF Transcript_18720/g.37835 Transcript_18720/m.37835 type:complete len:85 (-) Transcript_18720:459-713(-)